MNMDKKYLRCKWNIDNKECILHENMSEKYCVKELYKEVKYVK